MKLHLITIEVSSYLPNRPCPIPRRGAPFGIAEGHWCNTFSVNVQINFDTKYIRSKRWELNLRPGKYRRRARTK